MMKEKVNIKNTIYLNRSLDEAINHIAEENKWNFQKTLRYLLSKGIEDYNNGGLKDYAIQ